MAMYSTTARWEGCTQATAAARINHVLRDVEEQQGLYRQHSNELIDRERTGDNFSYRPVVLPDGSVGKEQIQSTGEVHRRLAELLESVAHFRTVPKTRMVQVKGEDGKPVRAVDAAGEPMTDRKGKPVYLREEKDMPNAGARVPVKRRTDAVVAVEELFQLDPDFTGPAATVTPEMRAKVQQLYEVWLDDLREQYGVENILLVSEHWDETSPHVSAFCVPRVERADGTFELNSKLVLTGKKKPNRAEAEEAYTAKHDRLREGLKAAGYEATLERLTPRTEKGSTAAGLPLPAFKKAAERATEEIREGVNEQTAENEENLEALLVREKELEQAEADFLQREIELGGREVGVKQRESAVGAAELATRVKLQEAERKLSEAHTEGFRAGSAEAAGMMSELQELLNKYKDVDELVSLTKQLAISSNTVWHGVQELQDPTIKQDRRELGDDLHKIEKFLGWRAWKRPSQAPVVERPTIPQRVEAVAAQVAANRPETVDDPAR